MIQSYCRLFLATPECFDPAELQTVLKSAISGGDIASLLIRHTEADKLRETAMVVTRMAQAAGIAVLIENDVETALASRADGVQLHHDASQSLNDVREQLGSDKIIGVDCASQRHSAMSAGEAGADYVAFDNTVLDGEDEPVGYWWARVFEVPCVIIEPLELEQARVAVANKVDFICPPQTMWASQTAARQTVQGYNAMIKDTQVETD